MKKYKKFLKFILSLNIIFIFVAAALGYKQEMDEKAIVTSSGVMSNNVIPMGNTVGIYVNTKGILVIDTGEVTDLYGNTTSPAKNKLFKGDYICKLNGVKIKTKKQLINEITDCAGKTLVFDVLRNNENVTVKIEPVETGVDTYKIGIWVRDDLQGLGTVTYIKGNEFGALGHSITDSDTGELMKVSGGKIYLADIYGVEKGISGSPGEIEGMITYDTENVVGDIKDNKTYGIYGVITNTFAEEVKDERSLKTADSDEVVVGYAKIQTCVSGEKKLYDIEIVNIHKNKYGDKEMEIRVTDKDLIALTGGIVQGMSGSPIIQNDKLVGAVTHVFVDDPTRGYGIFIEQML